MSEINFGGLLLSTIDWRGLNALMLFMRGCPLRCLYCQNFKLLSEPNYVPIHKVIKEIEKELDFIDALVFSGGEPTLNAEAIKEIGEWIHKEDKLVGIQTNGYFASDIEELIKVGVVDKIFLDIKAPLNEPKLWKRVTQVSGAEKFVQQILYYCINSNFPLQIQTTVFKRLVGEEEVLKIARELKQFKGEYVIQQGVYENVPQYGRKVIKKEDELSSDEIREMGRRVTEISNFSVYIRTREGEELIG